VTGVERGHVTSYSRGERARGMEGRLHETITAATPGEVGGADGRRG
jgi:hypothetical protein